MPPDSDPSTKSSLRLDLTIALFALLISTATAIASIYQSRIISNQLSASVWPYLSFTVELKRAGAQLLVENVGEGPAIIKGARLTTDGTPETSMAEALSKLLGVATNSSEIKQTGSIEPGLVLRPGEPNSLFTLNGTAPTTLRKLRARTRLAVCYCSLLNECWIADANGSPYPRMVKSCTDFEAGGIAA